MRKTLIFPNKCAILRVLIQLLRMPEPSDEEGMSDVPCHDWRGTVAQGSVPVLQTPVRFETTL